MIYSVEQKFHKKLGRSVEIVADERGLKDLMEACLSAIGCGGSSHPGYCANINVRNTGTATYFKVEEQNAVKFSAWPKKKARKE